MITYFLPLIFGGILLTNQANAIDELQITNAEIQPEVIVAVGSANPIKVQAVKNAFMNEEIRLIPCSALSNVREVSASKVLFRRMSKKSLGCS
jgi:hypothetical protein